MDHHSHGTQASILSSVVASLPASATISSSSSSGSSNLAPGEGSAEWRGDGDAAPAAAAADDPAEVHAAAQRALIQARQLSAVMLKFLEKTVAAIRDEPELAQCGDTTAVLMMRMMGVKELCSKQGRLEATAAGHVEVLGKWVVCGKGGQQPVDGAELQRLTMENRRLKIKLEAMERQVQFLSSSSPPSPPSLSSSSSSATAAEAATVPSSAAAAAAAAAVSSGHLHASNERDDDNEGELRRLRRLVEEQDELLHGLRTTLREMCLGRDPITLERDALRHELGRIGRALTSLQEEKAGIQRLCEKVQQQLRRTADRCQELEAYVRFVESQHHQQQQQQQQQDDGQVEPSSSSPSSSSSSAVSSPATTNTTSSVTPNSSIASSSSSPRRPPMVHDPGFMASAAPASTAEAGKQQPGQPGLLRWLLSFFLIYDVDEDDDDDEEEARTPVVV
jgi:hypothetical protein